MGLASVGLAAGLLGCGGDEVAKPDEAPVTVPLTLPTTAEQILSGDPDAPAAPEPPVAVPTPTTPATGLPTALGIPGAGTISLGRGSQISNAFTVREVPFLEVLAFVQVELVDLGWQVQAQPIGPDGRVLLDVTGPGAIGQAQLEPLADGTVQVRLVLQGG